MSEQLPNWGNVLGRVHYEISADDTDLEISDCGKSNLKTLLLKETGHKRAW